MLINQHMKRIVDACYPKTNDEAIELWHDIKPVKFGTTIGWTAATVSLAEYQIPENSAYLLVLRVECYSYTQVAAAPGFGIFSPPPLGVAFWQYADVTLANVSYNLTPVTPIHVLCDSDEFLLAKGDHFLSLTATLSAPPDANERFIRTLVYGYLIGALVADKIGSGEPTYSTVGLA